MSLKLFHHNKLIGVIDNVMPDELAHVGDIALSPAAAEYKELFAFFSDDEKRWKQEPPFDAHWLSSWFIEDERGERQDIDVPLLNEKGEIWWR